MYGGVQLAARWGLEPSLFEKRIRRDRTVGCVELQGTELSILVTHVERLIGTGSSSGLIWLNKVLSVMQTDFAVVGQALDI